VADGRFAGDRAQGEDMDTAEAVALARTVFASHSRSPRVSGSDGQPTSLLTAREHEVLRLLAKGLADKEIAAALGISRRTASKHVATILAKMRVESRTGAVSLALRLDLL
jgi:DNA-binding NarL/FixJ family response regulator